MAPTISASVRLTGDDRQNQWQDRLYWGFLGIGDDHYPLPWNPCATHLGGYLTGATETQLRDAKVWQREQLELVGSCDGPLGQRLLRRHTSSVS
jgi:hypothetical protein